MFYPCSSDSFRVNPKPISRTVSLCNSQCNYSFHQVLKPQTRTQFPMMAQREKLGERRVTTMHALSTTRMFYKFRDEGGLLETRQASSSSPLLNEFAKPPSCLSEQSDGGMAGIEMSKSPASHSPLVFVLARGIKHKANHGIELIIDERSSQLGSPTAVTLLIRMIWPSEGGLPLSQDMTEPICHRLTNCHVSADRPSTVVL